MDMLDTCLKQLEAGEYRRTKTREVILTILHEAAGPLSPQDILAACHMAGRRANKTTIYRDLEVMEGAGIIRRVMVSDRSQYFELTERGHHHHLVCTACQTVQDIHINDQSLIRQAEDIGKKMKFTIAEHAVEFYGLCQFCQGSR